VWTSRPGSRRPSLFFDTAAPFGPAQIAFAVAGINNRPVAAFPGLNTVLLTRPATETVDSVMLAASSPPGELRVSLNGSAAFAVAMVNVSQASGTVTIAPNTGSVAQPVTLGVCRTDPVSRTCVSAVGSTVDVAMNPGDTPTVAVFATAGSDPIAFAPAVNRIFGDAILNGITVGQTSLAIATVP